ncbi:NAD(P)/FAD-dependent oxidoreductase [Aliikangiella sp. IMCC44632]
MKTKAVEVAVIGAGIIGTCIAERLQRNGKQVLLIDKQQPGEGCSKGNAGHFASDVILPLANFSTILQVPKLLCDPLGPLAIQWRYLIKLFPWLVRFAWAAMPHKSAHTIAALKQLNRPSIGEFTKLLKHHQLSELMQQKGALTIFNSAKGQRQCLQHLTKVAAHGINVRMLSAQQLADLEPAICVSSDAHPKQPKIKPALGALYYPDSAHCIDPQQLVTRLAACFLQQQGQFQQAQVEQLQPNEKGVLISAKGLQIQAKKIVVAAGAWSKPLAQQLGFNVPLDSERGYHLMLPQPQVSLNRPISSWENSFVMTPMQHGLRLAGTVEFAGLSAPPNYQRADMLLTHAKKLIPQVNGDNSTRWMGFRPSLPDSLPVLDSTHQNKVLWAFGHQHLGLTQAAVSANIIAQLCFEGSLRPANTPFEITRF